MALKKTVDAIRDSRKWRASASKRMMGMTARERVAYLNSNIEEKLQQIRKPERLPPRSKKRILV